MANITHNRDIIVVGQQPWDTQIGSNCKDIALEFSKHNRVLYVNSPLDRNTLIKDRKAPAIQKRLRVIRGKENGLELVAENLWVLYPNEVLESINWLPGGAIHTFFNKLNNRRFARSILRTIDELSFKDFILFNDNDIFRSYYLKELLSPAISIYYSRDFMVSVDYWKTHGLRLEPQLIAKSDICVANSSYLAAYCKQYNPASFDIGQGCDIDPSSQLQASQPADMQSIPRPVIGYVGALVSSRLSIETLRYISQQQPIWSLVLIGPEDDTFKFSDLHGLPNVYFLGAKSPTALPAYIQHFDVCLNPQLVNEMTIGNYPRKVDEYLAQGKPVVATRTEAMGLFENHTYLADKKDDYITLIAQALREDRPVEQQKRRAFAATHTWQNSVTKIYRAIADYEVHHLGSPAHPHQAPSAAKRNAKHPQPAAE
ncbi:glycosyltransferase [Hymenobacter terricola]|uniref:glycosyltransferase n=1 Tax=Hymenobacter terricola TaxID=2819236 RepID=UPI001B3129F3|nr:glycosyltransferase [Hymenobacter terricola]